MSKRNVGSFDYKVINPNIKRVLKARSELDNTVQVAMPFVKATTTIKLPEYLGDGNIGFTLGLHAVDDDVLWDAMYGENSGNGFFPLVGYTYKEDGTPRKIYCNPPSTNVSTMLQLFDQGLTIENTTNFGRIAPPGITQMKIGRNKNGLLAVGEINFSVPSLPQLEILHRVFLIPGCGMVLEWGQQFANEITPSFGEFTTPTNISDHMFPWNNRKRLEAMLDRLAKRDVGLQEILEKYVYPTQGQYMWMFGRVANFSTKANSDGSFDCNVKIVGPSEDAWAYSTRSTVIPAADASKKFCTADAESVESYFTTTTQGWNLKSLLDGVLGGTILPEWITHVQRIQQGNKTDGEGDTTAQATTAANTTTGAAAGATATNTTTLGGGIISLQSANILTNLSAGTTTGGGIGGGAVPQPNVSQTAFAEAQDAYFFTWRFFVNVVINHPTYGLKRLFSPPFLSAEKAAAIGLLRPYADGTRANALIDNPGDLYINDPTEPYVGYNKYLRSIDPSVLIIVNEDAAILAEQQFPEQNPGAILQVTPETEKFKLAGDFKNSIQKAGPLDEPPADIANPDRGFLSAGVWLNHKTVCTSMVGGNTLLRGVTNLLERMNSATMNFWQLTLDQSEPLPNADGQLGPNNQHAYTVIDANWRGSSDQAVKRAIIGDENNTEPGLYVFNKYVRRTPTGQLVGSELTECTVDLSLPKRLFAQIATLGLVQKEDLDKVNADSYEGEKTALIADPTEALRDMFSITTLSPTNGQRGPDLTILEYGNIPSGQCASTNSATTAQTSGVGQRLTNQTTEALPQTNERSELESLQSQSRAVLESAQCAPPSRCAQILAQVQAQELRFIGPVSPNPYIPPQGTCGDATGITGDKAPSPPPGFGGGRFSTARSPTGNAEIPLDLMVGVERGNAYAKYTYRGESGWYLLHPEAAAAYKQLRAYAVQQGVNFTLTSAYRDFDHQKALRDGSKGGAAPAGSSPHGWGIAIDISELYHAVGGSINPERNRRARASNRLYRWFAENAPKFGWYNPCRLADGSRTEEVWHWEYWGFDKNLVQVVQPSNSSKLDAIFVAGLTENKTVPQQTALFKQGFGANKKVQAFEKDDIANILNALRQNPKTPVFLFSAGCRQAFNLANDPNIDKQKLFMIEPSVASAGTKSTVEAAIGSGVPSRNVFAGPTAGRGLGIAGASRTPNGVDHFGSLTYVGRQNASLTSPQPNPIVPPLSLLPPQQAPSPLSPAQPTQSPQSGSSGQPIEIPPECNQCIQARNVLQQSVGALNVLTATDNFKRNFPYLEVIFRYVESFPEIMVTAIRTDSDGNKANAFGAAPGSLSISADLQMPGINGIRVGELFWIDRIPAFYRAFGAFQIMSVEDTIGIDGWKTSIHSRFNYLGPAWRKSVLNIFKSRQPVTSEPQVNEPQSLDQRTLRFGGFDPPEAQSKLPFGVPGSPETQSPLRFGGFNLAPLRFGGFNLDETGE